MDDNIQKKLRQFFSSYKHQDYKKGVIIMKFGEPVSHIFFLEKGLVKQFAITENGEELTHQIFRPFSYFPIMLSLGEIDNRYYFETLTDVGLRIAPADAVISLLKANPDILFDLTTRLAKGLSKTLLRIETILFTDAHTKVVSLLLYLAKRYGQSHINSGRGNEVIIALPMTHNDIASWIGMQRETVSRQLENLQKDKLISYDGKLLVINDLTKLKEETKELN